MSQVTDSEIRLKLRQVGNRVHFVKQMVARKVVKFVYCRTDMNISDATTKPLRGAKFVKFAKYITEGGGSVNGKLRLYEVLNNSVVQACMHGRWMRAKDELRNNVMSQLGVRVRQWG